MLDVVNDFITAIQTAPKMKIDTFADEQTVYIANEDIINLWAKMWDGLSKDTVYRSLSGEHCYFRNDDTLYYMWADSVTVYVIVCQYLGWVDGKQVFQLMDINPIVRNKS